MLSDFDKIEISALKAIPSKNIQPENIHRLKILSAKERLNKCCKCGELGNEHDTHCKKNIGDGFWCGGELHKF